MISDRCCRLCLSPDESFHLNIFSEADHEMPMYDIIREHFKCEISETDSMPNFVCQTCWSTTETFHELYKKSKSVQERFLHKSIKFEADASDLWQQNNKEIHFIDESHVEVGAIKLELSPEESDTNDAQMDYDALRESDESTYQSEKEERNHPEFNRSDINSLKRIFGRAPEEYKQFMLPKQNVRASLNWYAKKPRKLPARRIAQIKKRTDFEKLFARNKHFFDMTCDSCPKTFETFDEARSHYASEHMNSKGYIKCCGKKITLRCKIREHLKWHLDPESLRCIECDKVMSNAYDLQRHIKNHTEKSIPKRRKEKNVACNICKKMFISEDTLEGHLKRHMERGESKNSQYDKFIAENFDMKCDLCETIFTALHDARRHYKEQHNEDKGYIKCCNTKLREHWIIRDHVKSHFIPDSFKCDICNKNYLTRQILVQHKRRHRLTMNKTFVCDYCGKGFRDKDTIIRHLYNKHVDLEPKYECEICNKKFKIPILLKNHKYAVHREKKRSVTCEICGKSFYTMFHLQKHLLSHTDKSERLTERTQCEYCGEWLMSKSGIYYHEQIHTSGVQKCPQCQMELPNKASLLGHIRSHHRERKFKCGYCEKTFSNASTMKTHEESHTRHKVYQCKFCPKTFTVQSSRRTHTRRNHPKEIQKK